MTERDLIDRIRRVTGRPGKEVAIGIGDDAAVCRPMRGGLVLTVDSLVEKVHFDTWYFHPEDVGHKALAVNLSDVAAMGGSPRYALVSLGLGKGSAAFWEGFYRGMTALARRHGVQIVGGNLSASPVRFADVTVVGEAPRHPFLRSGARAGDLLAVTGSLGASAAGLELLRRHGRGALKRAPSLSAAHLRPEPKLAEAAALRKAGVVRAAMDVSDGLGIDLHRLADASGVGFRIDARLIPVAAEASRLMGKERALRLALEGGEDYELLLAVRKADWNRAGAAVKAAKGRLTAIGEVVPARRGRTLVLDEETSIPLRPAGWDHGVAR